MIHKTIISACFLCALPLSLKAQSQKGFHIGGYGEVAFSRNFYSDNPSRYNLPDTYKDAPGHGRLDIPHAVLNISYDFGNGWRFGTEMEFEHGGVGTAYEKEAEEGGEWETETEKGGEVALEQFWIQKSFSDWANLRMGHIIVPVGLNNSAHEPLNFFTVYRPEGENAILPSTWHQTGISFWGRYGKVRYEFEILGGLNADNFTTSSWVNMGPNSPMEFDVANKFGTAVRLDYYPLTGLRLGLSGYYGHTQGNSYPAEKADLKYKGVLAIGSFDFTYKANNWIVRGQADYGYLGDTEHLQYLYNRTNKKSPYHHTKPVGKNAYAVGVEAGYDVFSHIKTMRDSDKRLYVFGRYDNYMPCADEDTQSHFNYLKVQKISAGLNYMPIKQIVIKGEYSYRMFKSPFNNEPGLNLGVAYQGFFL